MYVFFAGNVHDLVKSPPAVILSDRIPLLEANVVVRRDEDADPVGLCTRSVVGDARREGLHQPVSSAMASLFVNSQEMSQTAPRTWK